MKNTIKVSSTKNVSTNTNKVDKNKTGNKAAKQAKPKLASIKKVKATQPQYAKSGTPEMGAFTLAALIAVGLADLNKKTKVVTTTGAQIASLSLKEVMGNRAPTYWKEKGQFSSPRTGVYALTKKGATLLTSRVNNLAKGCNHTVAHMQSVYDAMLKAGGAIVTDKENGFSLDVRQPIKAK